ncbi:MAG: orotidine-5'-phosphate decarboxylase [Candidatus Omnitrophica bacterium]|nr:orotidine-5'-phosphate decarboxylase [Candidatus Omnitrophota bacterium]
MEKFRRKDRIIVALDVNDVEICRNLLDKLYPTIKTFKIGSQLFTTAGQEVLNIMKLKGAASFLDLKFHDIPATVGKSAAAAAKLGIDMFDVHACGGPSMMKKAVESSREVSDKLNTKRPLILGITVLTSMNKKDLESIGVERDVKDQVLYLAETAKKSGLDGVVASAEEIEIIKKKLGEDFIVITPGVRPAGAAKADQKRVATPKEAFDRGADYIVIGRPITEAEDPKDAAEKIISEIE